MDNTGITPVMPVGGDGSFMWIFGLLILLGLFNGGGFGFGGNGNTNALSADMQRGFDTQNTMAQTRDILTAVTNGTAQTIAASTQNASNAINAIKDGNAALIREFGNVETALTGLAGKQQECCCSIRGRRELQHHRADPEGAGRHRGQPYGRHAEPDQPASAAERNDWRDEVPERLDLQRRRVPSGNSGRSGLINRRAPA